MTSLLSVNGKPYTMKDWPSFRAFMRDLQPTTLVLCIDQTDQTGRIFEAKNDLPNTKIVARFIDETHDGSMHLAPQTTSDRYIVSPQNQLNRIKVLGQNGLSAYFGNEPNTKASPDDLTRLADHTVEAMDLAATRDYDMSLTVGNYGIGHPAPIDGFLPTWIHPILMKLDQHHDRHYLGIHLYLPMDILEFLNAIKRTCAERLKIKLPRIIVTEWGFDSDGTNNLNGFKTRMSNEAFAEVCINAVQGTLGTVLQSGEVLGLATFILGDDNWWAWDVETAGKGEVSTAWKDSILKAATAGKLAIKKPAPPPEVLTLPTLSKEIKVGTTYKLNTNGKIVNVYAAPSVNDRHIGTIADNALIEAGNTATVGGSRWLQIYTPSFPFGGWIEGDLIGLCKTREVPIVKPDPVPTPAPTPEPKLNPTQIQMLYQWRDKAKAEYDLVINLIKLAEGITA